MRSAPSFGQAGKRRANITACVLCGNRTENSVTTEGLLAGRVKSQLLQSGRSVGRFFPAGDFVGG